MKIWAALAVLFLGALSGPQAQPPAVRTLIVAETAGIRRTEYPASARVEMARGTLRDVANARLLAGEAEVPAQFTAESAWDDRSVRALSVDFNLSIGPLERRELRLEYGAGVTAAPFKGRGLAVTETADRIQAGNVRLGTSGAPLVLSASYVKSEFIGMGRNGFGLNDGRRDHDLSAATDLKVEILERGPLNVTVRYRGKLVADDGAAMPVTILVEMPNSKSWLRMTANVDDPGRRVRTLFLETPLAFGALPWTWDFGTGNNTYGAFRNASDTAVLTQVTERNGRSRWEVQTGAADARRPYERSVEGRSSPARGWGHLMDARGAVAFAVPEFGRRPGTHVISLDGSGQARFAYTPAQPANRHELSVYQHFVSTPVPIGAATSPAAMLSPLTVEVR